MSTSESVQQDSSVVSEADPGTQSGESDLHGETAERPVSMGKVRRSSVRGLRGILKKPRQEVPPPKEDVIPETPEASQESIVQKDSGDTESDLKTKRASLHLAAFDRLMFAKRGAELRNEYMRDFLGA